MKRALPLLLLLAGCETTAPTDAPASDAPGADTPGSDTPEIDAPGADTPASDAPVDGVVAASCERADVLAAIAAARPDQEVVVPAGECHWTAGVDVTGIVGLRGAGDATVIVHDAGAESLFDVSERADRSIELSHLLLRQGTGGAEAWQGMFVHLGGDGRPALLHHLRMEMTTSSRRAMRIDSHHGVVFECTFDGAGNDVSAIAIFGASDSWSTPHTMGTADTDGTANVYLEDDEFLRIPFQALDPDTDSRVVIRHNRFAESAMSSHGADTSDVGTRHWELYGNTFEFTDHGDCDGSLTANLPYLFFVRGGTGVITDNTIPDVSSCAWGDKSEILFTVMNLRRNDGPHPCWDTYPAPHQVGQGHDGTMAVTDPVYLWDNRGGGNYDAPGRNDYDPDECGGGPSTDDFVVAGRDYVTGAARPGWAPFAYPHPLRAGR